MFSPTRALGVSLAISLLLVMMWTPAGAAGPKTAETRLLERALKLLPEAPGVPVRLIDPDLTPEPESLGRLDAFLVREANARSGRSSTSTAGRKSSTTRLPARTWTSPSWRR